MIRYVSEVFDEKPSTWGLRGDPFFWEYLKDCYNDKELPFDTNKFEKFILEQFKLLTGSYPAKDDNYYVKQFANQTGGMSAGYLSGCFWLEKALPKLVSNLNMLNSTILNGKIRGAEK